MTVPHHSEPAREAVALLPCPFCGGTELVIREDISEDEPKRPYAFHVFCRSCHCHGRNNFPIGWAETEQSARDAWNTRASPAPAAGGLEAVDAEPASRTCRLDEEAFSAAVTALCENRKIGAFEQLWFSDQESIKGQARAVLDAYFAALASPAATIAETQDDLVSRAEVIRAIRTLGDQDADLALYGAADNARAREYGEAAATRACCAIALMPRALASPAETQGGDGVRDALERVRCDCQSTIDLYHRTGPSFTSPGGEEYEPTSFVIAKMEELISITAADLAPSTSAATRGERITARYTNWRGETAERTFIPHRVFFGSNEWHPEPQVLIEATDCEKSEVRTFAASGFANPPAPAVESAQVKELKAEVARVKSDREYVIGFNDGWDEAIKQNLRFPTMLRKMWAGQDVQKWIDDEMARIRASLDLATDAEG